MDSVTLRIYLTHFRGQRSALKQWMAPAAGTEAEAWDSLTAALGLKGVSVGQRWSAPAGVPALSGVAEYLSERSYDAGAEGRCGLEALPSRPRPLLPSQDG